MFCVKTQKNKKKYIIYRSIQTEYLLITSRKYYSLTIMCAQQLTALEDMSKPRGPKKNCSVPKSLHVHVTLAKDRGLYWGASDGYRNLS